MYYEINVSLNGRHFFATAERSITTMGELRKVLRAINEKFTEAEGYEVTVTRHESVGYGMDETEIFGKGK